MSCSQLLQRLHVRIEVRGRLIVLHFHDLRLYFAKILSSFVHEHHFNLVVRKVVLVEVFWFGNYVETRGSSDWISPNCIRSDRVRLLLVRNEILAGTIVYKQLDVVDGLQVPISRVICDCELGFYSIAGTQRRLLRNYVQIWILGPHE